MTESNIEMFEKIYYPPSFSNLAKHMIGRFEDGLEDMEKSMKLQIKDYLMGIAKLQNKKLAGPIAEITFSFLYTALERGQPSFRLDCYGENGRIYSASFLTGSVATPWIAADLEAFMKELEECAEREGLRRFVRPAEFERLKLRAVRSLLYYFAGRFKYLMPYLIDEKALSKITKEDSFVVGMGEYLDWQRPLLAILPEVDIFNCDSGTSFNFRRFPAYHYEKKGFRDLTITNARFTDCVFGSSEIDGCTMNDCVFDGCEFEETTIASTKMLGCLFLNCRLSGCTFTGVDFYTEDSDVMTEYYEPAEFYGCEITDSSMDCCNLSYCMVHACDLQRLAISRSHMEESGFLEKNGVIWPTKDLA